MEKIFEALEKLYPLAKFNEDIASYAEKRKYYSSLKEIPDFDKNDAKYKFCDIKKYKTKKYNELDSTLELQCKCYFELMVNVTSQLYPGTITCKEKDGTPIKHEFYSWFRYIPSSTVYHDVEDGGNYTHSAKVFYNWVKFLVKQGLDYPFNKAAFVAMIHDWCKTTHYHRDAADNQWKTNYPEVTHHALKSLEIAKDLGITIDSPDIQTLVLLHMTGHENEEDKQAVTLDGKNWLFDLDNLQTLQLLNCADCGK